MGKNANIGYYPFYFWYPWFYYTYYPYYYYYERLPAGQNLTLFFGGIPKEDLQNLRGRGEYRISDIGKSLDSSAKMGLKTIKTDKGDDYSTIWDKTSNKSKCNHYIKTDMMLIWLEYGKDKGDALCPACEENKRSSTH